METDISALLPRLTGQQLRPACCAPTVAEPQLLNLRQPADCTALAALLDQHPDCQVLDTIETQLRELARVEYPAGPLSSADYERFVCRQLAGRPPEAYGVWVYYPWRNCLVHLLPEADFVRVRTSRNATKITPAEQQLLAGKKIGVVGLSVGQSVALALALERIGGEIRLADFDTLDLSNLNRIRAGVASLGLPKTTLVRREIAEIDPFLRVVLYPEGITPANVEAFLHEGGTLDLLLEECDSLAEKVLLRERARSARLPVLMETSDRGMLDVERYDLDPTYPLLHGLLGNATTYEHLAGLRTAAEKLPYVLSILGRDTISERLRDALPEIGRSLATWPQLGTDVLAGGAIAAGAARRILLGEPISSGRRYFDPGPGLRAPSVPLAAATYAADFALAPALTS